MGDTHYRKKVLNFNWPKRNSLSSLVNKLKNNSDLYSNFSQINGEHPFKDKVPGAYVEYPVRKRRGGKVLYFNFELAKEMGLIPEDHPHTINRQLENVILETFGLLIINEYDMINKTPIKKTDILPNRYMCTRYLQLQHPDKKGKTSGDGRSMWNGVFQGGSGVSWDITSCGTGATCLSPATAIYKKFFKSGDPNVSYGCGYSEILDGLSASMMSEIFYKNGIPTERSLALIEFPRGLSVNIRAGKNLLRPSHFFIHLKQGQLLRLKNVVDFFIDRQISNGDWLFDINATPKAKYNFFLKKMAETFAFTSAKFEREYIFCWLDWDGDNILADGGIIDYGSIRQFGLFHHDYRYDDVDRMSTNILEQKNKAKYIVQTCAQIIDYLITEEKRNIKIFSHHPVLTYFEQVYLEAKDKLLLEKIGFNEKSVQFILQKKMQAFKQFERVYSLFERAKSADGPIEVGDGVTVNAVYCMRDILRELPIQLSNDFNPVLPSVFMKMIKSSYASEDALELTPYRLKKIGDFQSCYQYLIMSVAKEFSLSVSKVVEEIKERSSIINRYERVTGDSVIFLSKRIFRERKALSSTEFHRIYEEFIEKQILWPEHQEAGKKGLPRRDKSDAKKLRPKENKIIEGMFKILKEHREGL